MLLLLSVNVNSQTTAMDFEQAECEGASLQLCTELDAWKDNNAFIHPVFNNGKGQVAYYEGMEMPAIAAVGKKRA